MGKEIHTYNQLPTLDFKDEICDAVDRNQVVILTAETGAGKSTQVPQYLAEHGYTRVIVTQPRILAARNLTRRVREEWAERNTEDSSEIIGYRTAHERDDSGRTKILYCTDGLQLVRELTGSGTTTRQVLVLDEVHEWNGMAGSVRESSDSVHWCGQAFRDLAWKANAASGANG